MVAIYFSRPINRLDYVGMKFVSAFLPMVAIIVVTLLLYYGVDLVTLGEGWSYVIDTSPVLLSGCVRHSRRLHVHLPRVGVLLGQ